MTQSLPDIIATIRKAMEGVQLVSWRTGHLCRDDHSCDCRYIFADNDTMGAIASVHVDDGENDCPSLEEAKANQRFIAACNPYDIAAVLDALEKAERERDAAFAMSKCECGPDEACRNLADLRSKLSAAEQTISRMNIMVGQIANMKVFPDGKINRTTLCAAIEIASRALGGNHADQ